MSLIPPTVRQILERIHGKHSPEHAAQRLEQGAGHAPAPSLRISRSVEPSWIAAVWERLVRETDCDKDDQRTLADDATLETASSYEANIEGFIGTVKVPVGVIGPLRVNGLNACGDYFVPLATTEAALVASYGRGALVASRAGGISAALLYEGVIRTPAFVFSRLVDAGVFVDWVVNHVEELQRVAESTTRYGKLCALEPIIDANVVFLRCRFTTGDAAGQNIVTLAVEALCAYACAQAPKAPNRWYIEGNFSGDKKASFLSYLTGRGRKVTASVSIPGELVARCLGVSIDDMLDYADVARLGALLSGQIGAQGHFANALAALYLATGQDAACVAESAVGSTRMERRGDDLFMSVTLPNILVGSVGGGTALPSQSAGLRIMGLQGAGQADALAEVVAATCLCGEISIMAAIAGGRFAKAHRKLARER